MITNLTLASVASTVYQAQAAQAARDSVQAQRIAAGTSSLNSQNRLDASQQRQRIEAEKFQRDKAQTPRYFSDIAGQSLALSSVAFLQTFGGNTEAFSEESSTDGRSSGRQRGYAAYQQYSEIMDALRQTDIAAGEDSTANAADYAATLPRQMLRNGLLPTQDAPFANVEITDFTATQSENTDSDAPPYFQLSYTSFSRAMDFRNQAFAFPPAINLIG